jgi:hypothetical protein
MPGAKLSGSLLVRKDARMATTPADDFSAINRETDENALGGPVLVWSALQESDAEPKTNRDPMRAVHRAAAAPPTDHDPPVIGVIAETVSQPAGLDGHPSVSRRTVLPAVAVAVSVLAIGSVVGSLFLHPNGGKISTETALSVAPLTVTEESASRIVESDLQPPVIVPSESLSLAAADSATGDATVVAATPAEELPDHLSTGEPATARINSAFLARGDGLFVLGDLIAARMFYERAATAGHAQAALRLGETYDPAFLARTRFIGARGNAAIAAYWYQRARELGAPGADILLAAIAAETGRASP